MIVPRASRCSPRQGDGSAALDADDDDDFEVEVDVEIEVARTLDDLGALVERACTPSSASGARNANQAAKELLEQRKTINEQERLVASLRSDLASRSHALVRSEDKRRGLEGELADLRKRLREVETESAHADKRAARARDVAARALDDRGLAVQRAEDALRRLEHRHARELAERDRHHAAEIERRDVLLAAEREARAAAEEAHAQALAAERDRSAQALAERDQREACAEETALVDRLIAADRLEAAEAALATERDVRAAEAAASRDEIAALELAHAAAFSADHEARTSAVRRIGELETALGERDRALAERDRALAELLEQQARVLTEQERAHRSEIAASERSASEVLARVIARLEDAEKALFIAREELAVSVASHARDLAAAHEKREEALAERDRMHLQESRDVARAHRKALAEACARAEDTGHTRATATYAAEVTAMTARLHDAEQSLTAARARHERELSDWKLQVEGLREAAVAEQRLAQHATELHARARAELSETRRALEAAEREVLKRELTRDALADLNVRLARSRDTLDESGVRLAFGRDQNDEQDDDEDSSAA